MSQVNAKFIYEANRTHGIFPLSCKIHTLPDTSLSSLYQDKVRMRRDWNVRCARGAEASRDPGIHLLLTRLGGPCVDVNGCLVVYTIRTGWGASTAGWKKPHLWTADRLYAWFVCDHTSIFMADFACVYRRSGIEARIRLTQRSLELSFARSK